MDRVNTRETIQDTGKKRQNTKDQFYTKKEIAKQCINQIYKNIPRADTYYWIEPSAGNGVFLKQVENTCKCIGIDIDPKYEHIVRQNFLEWKPPVEYKDIIIFGNPPFGRQSSLCKKFIKYCCEFASVIAFILPLSFVKPSMNNVFAPRYHCIYSNELPKESFIVNNTSYDVPCVFQIWKKEEYEREKTKKVNPQKYTYVKNTETYDIIIRRVGVYAGKSYLPDPLKKFSPQSHYFIKLDEDIREKHMKIVDSINDHKFPTNTVGPRSLSKTEINICVNDIILKLLSEDTSS
jgi:hypothetical protein